MIFFSRLCYNSGGSAMGLSALAPITKSGRRRGHRAGKRPKAPYRPGLNFRTPSYNVLLRGPIALPDHGRPESAEGTIPHAQSTHALPTQPS